MVDTQLLDIAIRNSGKKKSYLAEKVGVSRQWFRAKLDNKVPFNNEETDVLCRELNITRLTDKEKIFFKK